MNYQSVLIVDDDPLIQAVARAFFERRDVHNVIAAMNGAEGLQKVDEHPEIDLVLCDLNMPDVDGLQFLRLLMERRFRKPIIIVSGEDKSVVQTAHNLAKVHGLPILGRIQKPLNHAVLEELLVRPVIEPSERKPAPHTPVTEADFRSALRLGEIRAHLQPLIDCETGHVVSAEALARWNHPDYGPIMPDTFVPIVEKAGLIPDLTSYILTDALKTKVACTEHGYDLRIAVNTDAHTIRQLNFPDTMAAIAARAGVPNKDIKLEVTERSLIDEGAGSMEVMTRLRLMRFGLSIDDFGTGNSNLKQLCTFPFTELKIDKAFLDGVANDRAKAVCLNAIVSLSKALRLETVAEGIETRHDLTLVEEAGIRYAQGYYISKPLAPDEFLPWLIAREPRTLRKRIA